MRVLVLDSGPTSSYHVMRSCARAGHDVDLASYERCVYWRSKYCGQAITAPHPSDRPAYQRFLLETVRTGHYGALFFCGDEEAEIVWDLRDDLEPHVQCFLPDRRWREVAFSKLEAYRHVEQLGIKVPRWFQPDSFAAAEAVKEALDYPLVIKSEVGSGGRLVRYACDRKQLHRGLAEVAVLAGDGRVPGVQEYIPGPAFVVHALFQLGEPMAICSHCKERDLPIGRGVTSAAITVHHRELDAAALEILRSLRWHGLAKLDFKLDRRDGRFTFIELDPRVSASIDITRVAGADQALMMCELAAGKPLEPQLAYRSGVRYRWLYPRDATRLLARPSILPRWLLQQCRRDTHWDLEARDPACTLRAFRLLLWHIKEQLRSRAVWRQRHELDQVEGFALA
jgi:predicted ATP-grasp superfamily ATP-dependent carboligase